MTIEMLKTFLSVAETRNFNRSAELLYVSQPTVTTRIKALEDKFGQALFIRDSKSVKLSSAGLQYLNYATKIYHLFNESETLMNKNNQREKRISVSAPVTTWDYGILRKPIIEYAKEHPNLFLSLNRCRSDDIIVKIVDDTTDLGIVYILPQATDVEIIPYSEEDLILVSSPNLAINSDGNVLTSPDCTLTLIRQELGITVDKLAEEIFYTLPYSASTDHPRLHLEMVKSGLGLGLIQQHVCEDSLADGTLVKLDCEYNKHPLQYKNFIIYRKRKEQLVSDLVQYLLSHKG